MHKGANMDKQNVKDFIREYKDLMNVMGIDIAHSELQDRYFVFRIDGIYSSGYDYFVEVEDEEDLLDVILSEMSYDMHMEMGLEDYETPECDEKNIADMISEYRKKFLK